MKTDIELAREAGFRTSKVDFANGTGAFDQVQQIGDNCLPELKRFADLVRKQEREQYRQELIGAEVKPALHVEPEELAEPNQFNIKDITVWIDPVDGTVPLYTADSMAAAVAQSHEMLREIGRRGLLRGSGLTSKVNDLLASRARSQP